MKIALIYSFKESDWFSVTKILSNLIKTYQSAFDEKDLVHINFPWDYTDNDIDKILTDLDESNVDKLIFVDHRPNSTELLKKIGRKRIETYKEVVIHVYGDFTLDFHHWSTFHYLMENINVKFICASHKQKELVSNLLLEKMPVYVCPFPVADEEFYYDEKSVEQIRKKHSIKESDTVFLYVGRLSTQKKNLETIKAFLELRSDGKLDASHKFFIAGGFDLLGQHYLREGLLLGEYFRRIQQVVEKYPQEIQDSLVLLGSVKNTELVPYYNTADYFLSMSTYHDEDYGMAVAESLSCGLPCIITDWAGYSSFNLDQLDATRYVSVKLAPKSPEFNIDELKKHLIEASVKKLDIKRRQEVSKLYKENFTVSACANKVKDIHHADSSQFKGFKDIVHRLGLIYIFKRHPFLNEFNNCFNQFYYEVYDCYAR